MSHPRRFAPARTGGHQTEVNSHILTLDVDTYVGAGYLILTIANEGIGALRWQLDEPSEGWIEVSRREGQITTDPMTVDVGIVREDAPEGDQTATLVITDDKGGRSEVLLTATVGPPAGIVIDRNLLDFGLMASGLALVITNEGSSTTDWAITVTEEWLQVTPNTGELPGSESVTVTIRVDRSVIAGSRSTEIVVSANPGGTERVEVRVEKSGAGVPIVSIVSPSDSARVVEGEVFGFEGTASDAEDGRLIGTLLVWSSAADGRLGTGAQLSKSLSIGTHEISLSATDSDGNTSSAIVTVFVDPRPNTPPVANAGPDRIVGVGEAVTLDGSASSESECSPLDVGGHDDNNGSRWWSI